MDRFWIGVGGLSGFLSMWFVVIYMIAGVRHPTFASFDFAFVALVQLTHSLPLIVVGILIRLYGSRLLLNLSAVCLFAGFAVLVGALVGLEFPTRLGFFISPGPQASGLLGTIYLTGGGLLLTGWLVLAFSIYSFAKDKPALASSGAAP
jgi:uncharacterized membrane protein YgdD (TMEM256/DUF423 family)